MEDSSPSFAAYAAVAVNTPIRSPGIFSYGVPAHLSVTLGQPVWVPFGRPILPGIVVDLASAPPPHGVKPIVDVWPVAPVLSRENIDLARWVATEYGAPLFQTLTLFFPPGAAPRAKARIGLVPGAAPIGADRAERRVIGLLLATGPREQRDLLDRVGRGAKKALDRLIRRGIVQVEPDLERARTRPRILRTAWIDRDRNAGSADSPGLRPAQRDLLAALGRLDLPLPEDTAAQRLGVSATRLRTLARRGLLRRFETLEQQRRAPLPGTVTPPDDPPPLTPDQQRTLAAIQQSLHGAPDSSGKRGMFLVHGVTGSGKTEVYLRAIAAAITRGRQGIVLVPEISLTPQMIERFVARFPGRVGVLHSRLTPGEHLDEWERIRSGAVDLVIGSRSAVFAPVPRLGLIVIDEEHEWTYKQQGQPPLYETRAVAERRAELTGATLVLGSATPDVVTRHRTDQGELTLLTLPRRVGSARLPDVEIVDLRAELRAGNRGIFSRALDATLRETLDRGEQAILFLNRRGAASVVLCRECGRAVECDRCDLPLTYHSTGELLICHRCSTRRAVPDRCPACESPRIKHFGLGTQRLEEETIRAYPDARVLRWDRDTTGGRQAHAGLLRRFSRGEADILVGTQMIAKGLDVPNVTLVGVVNADVGLYLPDYRSAERTFQLLAQVAGRAGRGKRPGRVIVQTYVPDHEAIVAAARHDYDAFYEREIERRRALWNPPFSRLTRLSYAGSSAASAEREARRLADRLREATLDGDRPDLEVIGPAPAFVARQRGRFVWQIVLRGDDPQSVLARCAPFPGWRVDVDPVTLL